MKVLYFILVALVLVSAVSASPLPDFPFVFAQGEATVEHPPDKAVVRFQVKAFDPAPSNAVAAVRSRSKEVLELCAKQKIKQADIEAHEIEKDMVQERKEYQDVKVLGYNVSRQFSVTRHNLDAYETFAMGLMRMENVEYIYADFGRTDSEEIEEGLVQKACADANQNATRLANGFGKELGALFAVSQHDFSMVSTVFGVTGMYFGGGEDFFDMGAGGDKDDFLFVPATVSFASSVWALFKLK